MITKTITETKITIEKQVFRGALTIALEKIGIIEYEEGYKTSVKLEFEVPSGADWSGLRLDIGTDNPLYVTLIKTKVFEEIERPWFEVDKKVNHKTGDVQVLDENAVFRGYGGHDVWFCRKLLDKGYKLTELGTRQDHYRIKELPKRETNHGYYTIYPIE